MAYSKKLLVIFALLGLFSSVISGCDRQNNSSSGSDSDSTLQGKPEYIPAAGFINGKRWVFKSGRAYRHSQFLIIKLWNMDESHPCEATPKTPLQVRLKTIPIVSDLNVGKDSFKSVPVIFFIDEERSLDPTNPFFRSVEIHANIGSVKIDNISPGPLVLISGRFDGSFTAVPAPLTTIRGSFEVPLCDENYL